jgi:hypothetical protein
MTKVGSNLKRSVDIRREGLHSLEGEKGIFLSDMTKLKNDELFFRNDITSQLNQLNKQCQGISSSHSGKYEENLWERHSLFLICYIP